MDPAFLQGEVARLEAELAGLRMAPAEPVGISQTAGVDQLMAELHSAQARARTRTQHITALTTGPGRRSVGGGGMGGCNGVTAAAASAGSTEASREMPHAMCGMNVLTSHLISELQRAGSDGA